jgi:hypothetical protein
MLSIKIWHIGHHSIEEWFGHHDTKPVLGDVMTDDEEKEEKNKEKKDEKKDEKKKSVAFKAISSKGKAKQDRSSKDEGSFSWDDDDDEKMALFVNRFGKFMVKKGYRKEKEVIIQEQGRSKNVLQVQ